MINKNRPQTTGLFGNLPQHLSDTIKVEKEKVIKEHATWNDITFYHPKENGETEDGYRGRIGIHEVLAISPTIKEMVLTRKTSDDIEAQARKEGMLTMLEDGIYKAAKGLTSVEEVLRVINE